MHTYIQLPVSAEVECSGQVSKRLHSSYLVRKNKTHLSGKEPYRQGEWTDSRLCATIVCVALWAKKFAFKSWERENIPPSKMWKHLQKIKTQEDIYWEFIMSTKTAMQTFSFTRILFENPMNWCQISTTQEEAPRQKANKPATGYTAFTGTL